MARLWFYGPVRNGNDVSLAVRLKTRLSPLFSGLLLVLVLLNASGPMLDNVDLGWHIAQGRWMVQHAAFYARDSLTYANLGRPVIDEYPVFQVLLYFAWKIGWWGPSLLTALGYLFLFGWLLRAGRIAGLQGSGAYALVLGLVLLYLQIAFPLRPHLVTYLGMVIFGTFLLQHHLTTRWIDFWPLALFQIAWVNSHSGFVLGPAMVGLFGLEIGIRQAWREKAFPWLTIRTWMFAGVLMVLACFVNPYGLARFYLPFYQDQLESIRAYVGEMEPLNRSAGALYHELSFFAVLILGGVIFMRRGAVSFSFLLLAFFFYLEALSVKKSWPIFGLYLPLILLSTATFARRTIVLRRSQDWLSVAAYIAVLVPFVIAVITRLDGESETSLAVLWQQFDHGQTEQVTQATAWMKAHGIAGRLFHRCEDGGWLEQEGYNQGEVYTDTGFGKYEEALIHETGLVGDRPALLPHYIAAYRPDFVIIGNFSFQWPFYLRQSGWRLIFYSPNSSVWTRSDLRSDLPTVPIEEVEAIFAQDLKMHGRSTDPLLLGRNLIALNSLGLESFTFTQLTTLPSNLHRAPWYWEAARTLCFEEPTFSHLHRDQLLQEAKTLPNAATLEFRAYAAEAAGDLEQALRLLTSFPSDQLNDREALLLLKIYREQNRPEALALAQRTDCFDLRDGLHWRYRAQAEEQVNQIEVAAQSWKKAIYYRPDDPAVITEARAFARRFSIPEIEASLEDAQKTYRGF